jgi:hypothetical protein
MPQDYEQIKTDLHATRLVLKLLLEEMIHLPGGLKVANSVKERAMTAAADDATKQAASGYFSDIPQLWP